MSYSCSGELFVEGRLQPTTYHMTIHAQDGNGLISVEPAQVTVSVRPPGNYPSPDFEQKMYRFTVREDTLPGITVGSVRATGPGILTYSIYSGDSQQLFAINVLTGAITVRQYLDADQRSSILLNIQASLGSPPSYNHTQVAYTD